ncbi:Uncharacterised protein [Klebsiella pneumoniae]|nr:Uncharacterised protein [Klebsiella pneumoniae]
MAHIGEEYGLGAGDHLTIHVQRAANLGELEGGPDEMVQAGGDKEFFKETIDEDPGDPGIFHKTGEGGDAVGHKGPNPGKGDGVEDNHRRHRHQRQLGAAVHRQRARQLNGRDFIVHPRNRAAENNAQENAHIHHHKAQQLGLPGAIIFTVNFFGESMGVFQPGVVGAKKHNKAHH